jgi:hypothetical protein
VRFLLHACARANVSMPTNAFGLSAPFSYEAWVIYNFMSLCMAYVGGPGAVVIKSEGKVIKPSWLLCTCCWKPIPVDGFFLRKCKQARAAPSARFGLLIPELMERAATYCSYRARSSL